MNPITYILVLLTTLVIGLFPIFKKLFEQLRVSVNHKQFDLLHKIVEEAVSYVNQIALIEELTADRKKEIAISIAQELANSFEIPETKQSSINKLIESILWAETDDDDDDDDEFDD